MGESNNRQVGGTHYRTGGTQHWDLFGPEYLVGCATKYVSRWRKKNGVHDLEKALHYCEKLLETMDSGAINHIATASDGRQQLLDDWTIGAELSLVEISVIRFLMNWHVPGNVDRAIELIQFLIWDAVPGTPEDGGHHSRQEN